jgi:hypothetical protein
MLRILLRWLAGNMLEHTPAILQTKEALIQQK